MLTRPFAPFRVRPLNKAPQRKGCTGAETIAALADETPLSIKAMRQTERIIKTSEDRLRVLKTDASKD